MAPSPITLTLGEKTVSVPTGLFINGQFVAGKAGKTFDVEDPATGKTLATVCEGMPEDVDYAVSCARKAFNTDWSTGAPQIRSALLSKLADLMEEHKEELIAVECADTGKTYKQCSSLDIPGSIHTLRYYAGWADKVMGQTNFGIPGTFSYTQRQPIGVCGQVRRTTRCERSSMY